MGWSLRGWVESGAAWKPSLRWKEVGEGGASGSPCALEPDAFRSGPPGSSPTRHGSLFGPQLPPPATRSLEKQLGPLLCTPPRILPTDPSTVKRLGAARRNACYTSVVGQDPALTEARPMMQGLWPPWGMRVPPHVQAGTQQSQHKLHLAGAGPPGLPRQNLTCLICLLAWSQRPVDPDDVFHWTNRNHLCFPGSHGKIYVRVQYSVGRANGNDPVNPILQSNIPVDRCFF